MKLHEIQYCPSLLRDGFSTYSPLAQDQLFGGRNRKVNHFLSFGPPGKTPELTRVFNEKRRRISISGVQEKYSLLQSKNELILTDKSGTHILKPVPVERLKRVSDMPANEHVTMQIARQLYHIRTAACGMIFFSDGSPAYLTKRFDYKADGSKYQVEDFAILLGKTPEKEGADYKYNASYLDIANLIRRYVPAARIELIRFFELVVFNYLFANGDAHLKNFALQESDQGDYLLAPAYDLLCTELHIDDSNLALHDGLYPDDMHEEAYSKFGVYTYDSFMSFANKIGVAKEIAESIINRFLAVEKAACLMIDKSFLSREAKGKYKAVLHERYRRFKLKLPDK